MDDKGKGNGPNSLQLFVVESSLGVAVDAI